MNSGKIFLIIFVVLASAVGLAAMQEYSSYESQNIEEGFSSDQKTISVEVSDGIGSGDLG